MEKNHQTASSILELVGGKDNVSTFSHCLTRLRFVLKDKSIIKEDEISKVNGVVGTRWLGDQLQVIIGTGADELYNAICSLGGFQETRAIDENLDPELTSTKSSKFNLKNLGNNILAYLSPTMTSIIPIMMAAALCKTIAALLGPEISKLIPATSDLYIVLNIMYNAFFYFIPFFLGYAASKALNVDPMYGLYLAALIMAPGLIELVGVRETINVFGIPANVANYSGSFLPVILGVWVMSYILKFLNRNIPSLLKQILVPLLTVILMAPIMLVVLAPLGTAIGNVVGNFFISLSQANEILRIFGAILLAVLMPFLVLGGMHGALVNFAILTFVNNGSENFILPIMLAYNFAVFGVALGAILRLKNPANKTAATGAFLTGILGSVTEPSLYGVVVKYKNTIKALLFASVLSGLIVGLFQPVYHVLTSATVFTFWIPWIASGTANTIAGLALMIGTFVAGAIAAFFVNYQEEKA